MERTLAGKTAIVTGGSRGIGAAIARRLAGEGADVTITYAGNAAAAAQTVEAVRGHGGRGAAAAADAGNPEVLRRVIDAATEELGGLDILVHNAGIAEMGSLATTSTDAYHDAYRRHMAVNVEGIVVGTLAALRHLRDGGRILLVGSVYADTMPFPGGAVYGASKAALSALARGWARDLGSRRILVNVIHPGPIDTDMNPSDEREDARAMRARTALGRYGNADEIASVAAFLAGAGASYVTGTTIDVDGGFSI